MRLDGYVRVSSVRGRSGESFISPAVQRERIEGWCRANGHELVVVHEELDASAGHGKKRPKFDAMIQRIVGGEVEGVVVWKASRFGRSFVESVNHIYAIRDVKGVVCSVTENLDTSTRGGRLGLNFFLSLAEDQLEDIREGWRDAKTRAVMRGVHPAAETPFGYRRQQAGVTPTGRPKWTGPLLVDPVTAPLVTELFERRADGESPTVLARWLNDQAIRTSWGREFSLRSVKDITRNRVYLGIAFAGDVENPDAHEPLTDPDTFARAQRRGRQFARRETPHEGDAARGLLRCAGCRYKMRGERRVQQAGPVWLFTCRSESIGDRSWSCDEPAYLKVADTGELDDVVAEQFLAGLPDFVAAARAAAPELPQLEREEARQRALLAEWRDDPSVQERLKLDTYLAGLEAREAAHQAAHDALMAARLAVDAPSLPLDAADLRGLWPTLTGAQRREVLEAGLQAVFARGRESRKHSGRLPLAGRVRVVWVSEAVDMPTTGRRDFVPEPFVWPEGGDGDAVEVRVALEQDPRER